jgi:HPt (histidine-containing phosphotransfer) domain-containing protein
LIAQTGAIALPVATDARAADEAPASDLLERKESIVGRFGGSEDLIRKALGVFVDEMERHLDDLREEAEQNGEGRSAALLHAIKGSAGTMGAKMLADFAAALEHRVHAEDENEAAVTPGEVDRLERLLIDSVARLRVVFGDRQNGHATAAAEQLETEEYRARLGRLLERLEASNLEALDLAETLAPHVPSGLQPRFDRLLAEIEALDFVTAAASTREMLDQLTC